MVNTHRFKEEMYASEMERSVITGQLLSIITLQNDKVKDCDQHPPQYG
ncbi:hypothetical protein [Vibrio thalassae]|nr:hypothetical protein [Vibrio thalassae]